MIVASRNPCVVRESAFTMVASQLLVRRVPRVNHDNRNFRRLRPLIFIVVDPLSASVSQGSRLVFTLDRSAALVFACEPRFRKVMYRRRMTLECSLGVPANRPVSEASAAIVTRFNPIISRTKSNNLAREISWPRSSRDSDSFDCVIDF